MGRFGCIFRNFRRDRQDCGLAMKTIEQVGGKPKADFMEIEERRRFVASP